MNREIKFRAQKISNAIWVYGSLVYSNEIDATIYFQTGGGSIKSLEWVYVKPDTIGQFTGLYDNRGKEIYEGDIIKVVDCVMVVKYIQECCSFCFGNIETLKDPVISKWGDIYNYHQIDCWYWDEFLDDIVVVGNIHDNPELLNGTS